MSSPRPVVTRLVIVSLLLALAACGDDPAGPDTPGDLASIRVSANVSSTPIDLLVVTVSAPDIAVAPVFNLPVNNGVASGTVRVPPGNARQFSVTAFDASGEITHEGSATRNVQRGQNPPLAIPLTPRSGQVPLTISFGDFSVVVTPAAQAIDLTEETSLQLTVIVTNAEGAAVPMPEVGWATTDPSRAQVNSQGLVTLLLSGEVDIVATYNGIAGISHLTLSGVGPSTYYADSDADGYGDPSVSVTIASGETAPSGYVPDAGDCDDLDASVSPAALEIAADGVDNNCNGMVDEEMVIGWFDMDLDGYGDPSNEVVMVAPLPTPYIPAGGAADCNPMDPSIHPGATETIGDGVDSNCDGSAD